MDASLFGKLPGELRNKIWRDLLVSPEPVDVTNRTHATEPAILATCQQVRQEATSIYYSENTFSLWLPLSTPPDSLWLQAIGPRCAKMITSLSIHCPPVPFVYFTEWDNALNFPVTRPMPRKNCAVWVASEVGYVCGLLRECGVSLDAVDMLDSIPKKCEGDEKWPTYKSAFEGLSKEAKKM